MSAQAIGTIIGFLLIAIVLSVVAVKNAKNGKKYKNALVTGIVIYVLATFGSVAQSLSGGDLDITNLIAGIVSICLLIVMIPVCGSISKKNQAE